MGLYILIAILVLFLVALAAAYFGSSTWHWAQVTVVVLIFVSAAGYYILAAEVLRINAVLRSQANRLEEDLTQKESQVEALRGGTRDNQLINRLRADEVLIPESDETMPSLADIENQLHIETRIRGKVWRGVAPAGFDPQTGTLHVTVEQPRPTGIEPDTVLFVFEQGNPSLPDPADGAQYLGQFRVSEAAGPEVALQSVEQLDQFEVQRLSSTPGPLVLHETMPVDRYELFAGLDDEALQQALPEASVEEYLRHGSEPTSDDDPLRRTTVDQQGDVVGPDYEGSTREVFHRRLRDYAVEFSALARQRVVMAADQAAVMQDNERLQAALASAEQLQRFREEQIRQLGIDLAGVEQDRKLIEQHLAALERQQAHAEQLLDESIVENVRLAERLRIVQQQWEQVIEERSSADPADGPLALSR